MKTKWTRNILYWIYTRILKTFSVRSSSTLFRPEIDQLSIISLNSTCHFHSHPSYGSEAPIFVFSSSFIPYEKVTSLYGEKNDHKLTTVISLSLLLTDIGYFVRYKILRNEIIWDCFKCFESISYTKLMPYFCPILKFYCGH